MPAWFGPGAAGKGAATCGNLADGLPVFIGCVRRLNRIETVGETLRVALEAIAAISPAFIVALLEQGWDERYGRKVETCRLLSRKNASAQVLAD